MATALPVLALALSVLAAAGALIAVGIVRAHIAQSDVTKMRAELDAERAAIRREFAMALEDAAGIGEVVDRHRRRIAASESRRKKQPDEEQQLQQQELAAAAQFDSLDAVRARARARGLLR